MGTTRVRIDTDDPATLPEGRIDPKVVDGTTEAEIALQQQEDEAGTPCRTWRDMHAGFAGGWG